VTDYEILGVEPSASPEAVREAYVFLVSKFHPDANPGREEQAAEHFRKVDAAYKRLRDARSATSPAASETATATPSPTEPPRPANNCSMDAFIAKVTENYEPERGKAVAKPIGMTILKTGLMNALTLPFGRVSVGVSTYKPITRDQYKAKIRAALYPKVLETKHGKTVDWFRRLIASYDKAPIDVKVQILTLATKEPAQYLKWVLGNLA
jgi:DnaJ domain